MKKNQNMTVSLSKRSLNFKKDSFKELDRKRQDVKYFNYIEDIAKVMKLRTIKQIVRYKKIISCIDTLTKSKNVNFDYETYVRFYELKNQIEDRLIELKFQ